jgi:hypothetical protein
MTAILRFRDHQEFHRTSFYMVGAGTAMGALAAAGGANVTAAAGLVGLSAVLAAVLAAGGPSRFAVGLRGRRLATLAVGVAVGVVGYRVMASVLLAQELASWPPLVISSLAGAGFSLVGAVAFLPRHVDVMSDRVRGLHRDVSNELTGEVRDLCERGVAVWREVEGSLEGDGSTRGILEDAVARLLVTAARWQAVERTQSPALATSLVDRLATIDQRIEASEDPVATDQYKQARAALTGQLRYLQDIGKCRERVLARMHNYVAAIEQLRMALVNFESTQAVQDVQPLLSDLQEIGREVDCTAAALDDLGR